jgi:HD superfamily phosphohydrolase
MRIYDPLYGQFFISAYLERFAVAPEVRRLSQIRLLNTLTPSLATLGELRRYSHTLGVLHLAEKTQPSLFSEREHRALAASVLLHDIGTPPFAHLMEYQLNEIFGWSHEQVIRSMLYGCYAPENTAHQIFAGRTLEYRRLLEASDISSELVEAIITGQHPLSKLLFGSIDLDNLDNVARMAWALGFSYGAETATFLASAIEILGDGGLGFRKAGTVEAVDKWNSLRRSVYEVLIFDPYTVSAQAVLSDAIGIAMTKGVLTEQDATMTDEELIEALRHYSETKDSISLEYLGRLPWMAVCIQLEASMKELGLESRRVAAQFIETELGKIFDERVLGYIFVDKGTFEKKISLTDLRTDRPIDVGRTSCSVVLYGFVRSMRKPSIQSCERAAERLISCIGKPECLRKVLLGPTADTLHASRSFDFASRTN